MRHETALVITTEDITPRRGQPITLGVPLPLGGIRHANGWFVQDGDRRAPVQTQVLATWPDKSLRWVLVDAQVDTHGAETRLMLHVPEGVEPSMMPAGGIRSGVSGEHLLVETGAASYRLTRATSGLIESVRTGHGQMSHGDVSASIVAESASGEAFRVSWRTLVFETSGPLRTTTRAQGVLTGSSGIHLDVVLRMHFFARSAAVKVSLTILNPNSAEHAGGYWELGDPGSTLLRRLSFRIDVPQTVGATALVCSPERGGPVVTATTTLSLQQHSSGGDHWNSTIHVNRHGTVPMTHRGYRLSADGEVTSGLRATPVMTVASATSLVSACVPEFWQNFPRGLAASRQHLAVELFPTASDEGHELQAGEQKTHDFVLLFGEDGITTNPLDWCRTPAVAGLTPEWYAAAEAVPYLTPAPTPAAPGSYDALVELALVGNDTFAAKRERIDEYGWRNFGEIYGDHEAVFSEGPLVSHYNNQYDPVAGMAIQFMRSGDSRWWLQCMELAAHVKDIDIYHTSRDKSAYNGGLFWHTVHYVDAGRATHRTYPRATGSNGGGPSSEHNYATGFLLHYYLTGDPTSRDAAIGLARFVIDIDDGSKTIFRWLARGDTGLATASRTPDYQGPGRGSGNSLSALVDGHRLTGDAIFLTKAEQVIRRCTHPRQDVGALNLLDAENRWFYTMYLQALGKYLDYKIELGQLDAMYAYGRAVLLHFARWMADNEYPYLTKPERLEYPTETWAAQDIRKSEVFFYAARHAEGGERERFLERARYFHEYSTTTLSGMATRALARPIVLLLSFGFRLPWFTGQDWPAAPMVALDTVPPPVSFVPQKQLALRRARWLIPAAGAGTIAAVIVSWLLL